MAMKFSMLKAFALSTIFAAFFVVNILGEESKLDTETKIESTEAVELPIRLSDSLKPIHYLVKLQPFINGNFTFNGYVEFTFEVKKSTDKLILHINDIITDNETAKVYLVDSPTEFLEIKTQEYNRDRQFYIATLASPLQEGKSYIFSIHYEGYLNDDMNGFFRSSYIEDNGNKKFLAATQFQATDARKAFPCMDEPALKAKFTIEIAREDGLTTISNMPLVETVPVDGQQGWFWDRFNTTPPMSTYLVAFVVSDFVYLEANNSANYKFRVYARKSALPSAEYALKIGFASSQYFEKFFDVPFPLPKQDMIALPDFSAGAMENWGLITYRESAMLYDPMVAKASDKMRIATTISHEVAHQWFGNIVTPSWWTDLWLNEGFASYMEYIGLRDVEESMRPLDQFVVTHMHSAFALDSLESSHPISVTVTNPEEINEIFDTISYDKGASIIRMMSSFLTEGTFRKGLSKYLTELSYLSAEQDDLWKYLTEQGHADGTLDSEITVKMIMDTWTLQMGYPLVTVKRNPDGTAALNQERYLLAKNEGSSADDHDYKWWIPITFTTQSEGNFSIQSPKSWMKPSESVTTITGLPKDNEWIIFNVDQSGYYRVNYDADDWKVLSDQLAKDPTVIADSNRAQIIDDSLNIARAGKVSYETALGILSYLKNEKEYVPIKAALNNLDYLKNMLSFTAGYGLFKNYLLSLIIPIYDQIDFVDHLTDPHSEQRKRAEILMWACELGHQPCIDAAVELYNKWMQNPDNSSIISPNLKSVVYCTGIKEGGDREWKFAWDRYTVTHVGTEQKELLQAMGCSQEAWVLAKFLNNSLTANQGIKKQMVRYIVPAIAKSEIGRIVAWQFLRSHWGDIVDYFGSVSFVLNNILEGATQNLNTEVQLKEMKSFKETWKGKFSSATRAVEQASENLQNNVHWMNNYYELIIEWLKNNDYKSKI